MASSDVIELGSSDDDAEPVPKKKKPTLNAMVHFPNAVSTSTIKSVKPAIPNLEKVLAGGAVTITNVRKRKIAPQAYKTGQKIGRSGQKFIQKSVNIPIITNVCTTNPLKVKNLSVNPLSVVNKQHYTRVQAPKLSLPPGITVKRAPSSPKILPNMLNGRKKINMKRKQPAKIITTVELDDDEVPLTSGPSLKWYLRPEEETDQSIDTKENDTIDDGDNDVNMEKCISMESENNREPEIRKIIEITIEDSPIKHLPLPKGFEVGSVLPITIEDSPIKPLKSDKDNKSAVEADDENDNIKEPQSKKRLDYPNHDGDSIRIGVDNVEIDLEIVPGTGESSKVSKENQGFSVVDNKQNIEVKNVDTSRTIQTATITQDLKGVDNSHKIRIGQQDGDEFHPVYQKFIDLCFELENSDDMAKIVEKKIKTYYRQCPKEYVESEEFIDMVSGKICAIKEAPDKMYLFIKDIVDELNLQRKTTKKVEVSSKENKSADDKYFADDDDEYDSKRRRQIRKLEKTIKKLHRAIQKLEEQEVEFEDEEDSVYLLTERYKERLIRVHAKFCQLTNTKMPSEPRIVIEPRPGQPTGPAKKLEKWVNKKVPIGKPLPFPDFHDVIRCVREANEEDRLGWNEVDIMEEARDLFTRCGKKLQRRRQENEWRIAAARITSHDGSTLDPAEKSDDLKKQLEENKTVAARKEIDLLNKYADRQNQLKLVGEEIGDIEAEVSPVESDDEEGNDDSNSLEDKHKRKERLKRLLHEKTRLQEKTKHISSQKSTEEKISETKVNTEEQANKEEYTVVEGEKQMQCDSILQNSENKKDDILGVSDKTEVISNNTPDSNSKVALSDDEKQDKSYESKLYDVDSDADEMHLLQKLYSENEMNSSTQESDSDTPIAISDTLDSDSDIEDVKIQQNDDIISIENSSYSESEVAVDKSVYSKSLAVTRDKSIDGLLLQNAEVLLVSSTSKNELNIEEEDILLASSEEENNVDTPLSPDKIEISECDARISNDDVASKGYNVELDNRSENFVDSNMKTYEVPLDEGNSHAIHKSIKASIIDGNNARLMVEFNKEQFKIKVDASSSILCCTEKSENNLKTVESKVKVLCNDRNVIEEKVVLENEVKKNCGIDNYTSEKNCYEHKTINHQSCNDKGNIKAITSEDINSGHSNHNFGEFELNQKSGINQTDESVIHNVTYNSTEKDLNMCKGNNVNIEVSVLDSTLIKEQSTNEVVEDVTGV